VAARTCTVDGREVGDVEIIVVGAKTRRNLGEEEEEREEDDDDNKCQHVTRTYIIRKCKAHKKKVIYFLTHLSSLSLLLSFSTFVQHNTDDYKSYSS
jgi:hypothetical protein